VGEGEVGIDNLTFWLGYFIFDVGLGFVEANLRRGLPGIVSVLGETTVIGATQLHKGSCDKTQ
jgi:hypothetical protein